MDDDQKYRDEQTAMVCTKSLINIAKDLQANDPVLADLCLFIAKTLADKSDPEGKVVHTHEPGGARTHETTVKQEIQDTIAEVKAKSEFADDK